MSEAIADCLWWNHMGLICGWCALIAACLQFALSVFIGIMVWRENRVPTPVDQPGEMRT